MRNDIDLFHLFICLAEERQDQNAKRRKLEQQNRQNGFTTGPSPTLGLTVAPTAPNSTPNLSALHPSLPQRPVGYDFAANADSIGLGAAPTPQSMQYAPAAVQALAGSNHDVVANRRAIRMANMSAAQTLKAEISGLRSVKPDPPSPSKPLSMPVSQSPTSPPLASEDPNEIPGFTSHQRSNSGAELVSIARPSKMSVVRSETPAASDMDAEGEPDTEPMLTDDVPGNVDDVDAILAGAKRKFEEGPGSSDDAADTTDVVLLEDDDDDDAPPDETSLALKVKVNADGTVEQEDTVKFVVWSYRFLHLTD